MKYLFPCLLVLPLLTSCVEQDPYGQTYYNPPPRVEVERHDDNHHYHHNNEHYGSAPQGRVYHGHTNVNDGSKVIVNSHTSQRQVEVQQNTHGHGATNSNLAKHPHPTGEAVVVPGAVRGQSANESTNVHGKAQQTTQSQDETQGTAHGHN